MASLHELVAAVQARAGNRCEFCRMHQALQGATFHLEHVTPRSKGGATELDNLAWACPSCNFHKSDRTHVSDASTGANLPLFNPRQNTWMEHFAWNQYHVVGLTPIGKATIETLHLNSERRLFIREAEAMFDLFPP